MKFLFVVFISIILQFLVYATDIMTIPLRTYNGIHTNYIWKIDLSND